MKKKAVITFFVLMTVCAASLFPQDGTIDPGLYLSIARSATDIIRVINRYHELLGETDPVVLAEAEGYFPLRSFDMPTDLGATPLVGYPNQLDAILFWRFLSLEDLEFDGVKMEKLTARAFFLASVFGFMLNEDTINNYVELRDNDITSGWTNGYGLLAFEFTYGPDIAVTIGGNIKYTPYITGGAGSELFALNPFVDEGEGVFPTHTFAFSSMYFDARIYGYTLNTFLSLSGLEQLALEKLFDIIDDVFSLGPSLYWFNAISSLEPGVTGRLTLFDRVDLAAGVYAGFDVSDFSPTFSHAFFDAVIPVVILANDDHPDRSFDLSLVLRSSVAQDYYGDIVLGGSAEIQLNNMKIWTFWDLMSMQSYLSIIAGITFNYHEALARLPLPGEPVLYAKLRIALY